MTAQFLFAFVGTKTNDKHQDIKVSDITYSLNQGDIVPKPDTKYGAVIPIIVSYHGKITELDVINALIDTERITTDLSVANEHHDGSFRYKLVDPDIELTSVKQLNTNRRK